MMETNWETFIEETSFEMYLKESAGFLQMKMSGSPSQGEQRVEEIQ